MTRRSYLIASLLGMATAGCRSDHGTGPAASGPAILRITSGGSGTDTILSTLAQPVVVQVSDSAGHPFVGIVVRFDPADIVDANGRSEEHTSELQSHSFISYAV